MKHINIFSVIILFLLFSCNNNPGENREAVKQQAEGQGENNSFVTLTESQEKEAEIQTGKIEEKEVREKVSCKGVIEVLPNYIVSVIPPVKGYIKEFYYETGDYVKKGAKLVRLSHPEILRIQEEYLSVRSQAKYYKTEYERQGELAVEKAASLKKMQKAEANYLESDARLQSLKQKLDMMNIKPDQIKEGELISDIYLYASIGGYITEMNSNTGKLADGDSPVYEIMNLNHLRLRLNVPEKEVSELSEGQQIRYSLVSNHDKEYTTRIANIGNKVDVEEQTLPVYAEVQNPEKQFKHGSSVKADISVSSQHQHVLPNDAIVEIDEMPHVFLKEEQGYEPFKVKTGKECEGYTIIENHDELPSKEIVTEGSLYLKKKIL
ncbi:MAG: efflux RND transporter periplasmic adaptor subunit [Bacteroidota bacterium]